MTFRSDIQLLIEIGRLRDALTRSEEDAHHYRKAFAFLLQDPEFPAIHVRLRKHLKENHE